MNDDCKRLKDSSFIDWEKKQNLTLFFPVHALLFEVCSLGFNLALAGCLPALMVCFMFVINCNLCNSFSSRLPCSGLGSFKYAVYMIYSEDAWFHPHLKAPQGMIITVALRLFCFFSKNVMSSWVHVIAVLLTCFYFLYLHLAHRHDDRLAVNCSESVFSHTTSERSQPALTCSKARLEPRKWVLFVLSLSRYRRIPRR